MGENNLNDNLKHMEYNYKHSLPPVIRDVLVGACTMGLVAVIALVVRMDKTIATFTESHMETHKRIDSAIMELKDASVATSRDLSDLTTAFVKFEATAESDKYTAHDAYADQKKQAQELKALWDTIHRIQMDIQRIRNGDS